MMMIILERKGLMGAFYTTTKELEQTPLWEKGVFVYTCDVQA